MNTEESPDEQPVMVTRVGLSQAEAYGDAVIHFLVGKHTNGSRELTLAATSINAGGANPLHRHPNCEEALYVLSGEIEHVVEGSPNLRMIAGDAICIPRNRRHQAINIGDSTAQLLVAFSSAERESIVD